MTTPDARIADIAEAQCGRFLRSQAMAVGFTQCMIDHRLRTRRWVREGRGRYRLAGAATSNAGIDPYVLALPGAVVSHQSAARMHDFPLIPASPPTVTVPVRTTHDIANCVLHESTDLAAWDCETRGGVTLTNPTRTVIDLAVVLRPQRLYRMLDELLAAKVVDFEQLCTRFDQIARRGKPGVRVLRARLEELGRSSAPTESVLEAATLELLAAAGIDMPVVQAALPWRQDQPGRVDLLFPAAKLIIECDGRRWHSRERDFERDRRRDNEAMLAGWRVLRITWDELRNHPERVIADVRRALSMAA